jgi:hypothetical protein
MRPSESVTPSSITGLNLSAYPSSSTSSVTSMSWPFSSSVFESVNGTVKTSGRLPPASWTANVGPSHSYSTPMTSMSGFAFSNCASCSANAV